MCRGINYPPQCTTRVVPAPMRQVCTPTRPPAQNPSCGSINGQIKELKLLLESLDQSSERYAAVKEKIGALTEESRRLGCGGSPTGLRCCPSVAQPNDPPCEDCGYRCLSVSTRIATPLGEVIVADLKVGDIVWTVNAAGNREVRSLTKVSKVEIMDRNIIGLALTDGRSLDVSGPHPTANGKTVGELKEGDAYDGSVVQSIEVKPYEGSATYDILPAGETGFYWANGILMGSTLK